MKFLLALFIGQLFLSNPLNYSNSIGAVRQIGIYDEKFAKTKYQQLKNTDLSEEPFLIAVEGYAELKKRGLLRNQEYLTICDFTKSSNEKRFYVIDTKDWQVIYHRLVAHGKETGGTYAKKFSNTPESHQSSVGFYLTGEIYNGKHDKSMKLDGLEPFNDNARKRGIVVHAAEYVSESFITENGMLGRSFGCPTLPFEGYDEVVDHIKNGSLFFIYYPDKDYLKQSKLIN